MKNNSVTLIISLTLAVIFGLLLFCFQVRQTEVALVTRFGKPVRTESEPGLKFKLPWPIEAIQKFDKRIQNFEGKFTETRTQDGKQILVMVYGGWSIADPTLFRASFAGSITRAQMDLDGLIRSAKDEVIGRHPFANFISTDAKELKFVEIEKEMLAAVRPTVREKYGIDVSILGIQRLGLPESITQKALDRMRAERQRFVDKINADGESEASKLRATAERDRAKLLAEADGEAKRILGEAQTEAAKYFAVFEKNPDLAIFLQKLTSLEMSLKDKSTLILDRQTPPFDLLNVPKVGTSGKN